MNHEAQKHLAEKKLLRDWKLCQCGKYAPRHSMKDGRCSKCRDLASRAFHLPSRKPRAIGAKP